MTQRPLLLLSNDDGFDSPGIKALYDVFQESHDVVVAAPRTQQSGIGHAFTFNTPLIYEEVSVSNGNMPGYIVHGTPSDCVKFAVSHLLPRRPDVVVSGMNIGENSGISAFYSGTVAAAREGAFWEILSVAFSVEEHGKAHLQEYASLAQSILSHLVNLDHQKMLSKRDRVFYNVNFPTCHPSQCRGIKVTRQSLAFFDDRYRKITLHEGGNGYEIYGQKKGLETGDYFDSRALLNNYATVTPLHFDATAENALAGISSLEELSPKEPRRIENA